MIALWEAWNSDLQINVFELVQLQKSILWKNCIYRRDSTITRNPVVFSMTHN